MSEKIPKGWVQTTLGEVCALNPRLSIGELPPAETDVSFVPMSAVEEETGRLDASDIRTIDSVHKGYTQFEEGDVVFAKITPCMENGKIAVATGLKNGLAYGSTELSVLRPYKGLFPRFVFYFLLQPSFRQAAEQQMTGAVGQKRVSSNYLSTHAFLLPPTSEQERIVTKLDELLAKIAFGEAAAYRALDRIKRYRDAVLNAAVTGELTREWRENHESEETGAQLLERLLRERREKWERNEAERLNDKGKLTKDSSWKARYPAPTSPQVGDLLRLPADWAWGSIDQLSWTSNYGTSVRCTYEASGPAVLRIPNVRNREIDFEDLKFATDSTALTEKDFVEPGDVLLVRTNGSIDLIGRAAVIKEEMQRKFAFASYLIRFRLVGDHDLWSWVSLIWDSNALRSDIRSRAATTAGQYNVSLSGLVSLAVPLPPLDEQKEIVREVKRRFKAADDLTVTVNHQLERSRAARRVFLQEAFAGKLVPQDTEDEPASALLERIRAEKVTLIEQRKQVRTNQKNSSPRKNEKSVTMNKIIPSVDTLRAAWTEVGQTADAKRLFEAAGFAPDQVVQFYELLRSIPEIRESFEHPASTEKQRITAIVAETTQEETKAGRFRLISLWLADFKNLKNYDVKFNPGYGFDVILGWNGTGKSNLFEALVIIFRDLHYWWEKNKWPDEPMSSYRLLYEIENHLVEISWDSEKMKRPQVKTSSLQTMNGKFGEFQTVRREDLQLPKFIFAYYSGPTNRLAEHFLPMKRDHYDRLRKADRDDATTLAWLLEQRRFFCAETHHAKYVLLAFSHKEDPKISRFLEERLRILGFESALFIIRRPRWARTGSTPKNFWGATGIMLRVMEKLRDFAIAPMVIEQTVSDGYRSTKEDHYYFFLPDAKSLHQFAAEYEDARSFFLALESTDFSELIHDAKIQVRVKSNDNSQLPITFRELSEGEQQLLMVLGLMRFTKSHQSLVLLDEPDTHLNPHWSVDYIKDLATVVSDDEKPSPEQQSSQQLMATHDPLVIASLFKEQIHLLKREQDSLRCYWEQADIDPRGLGFTGILTSQMFGFRSDLDPETLADLDNRVRLIAKESGLTDIEKAELQAIDERLAEAGFSKAFSDPYYAAFVRAWGRKYADQMAGQQFLSQEEEAEIDRIAREVLEEAITEVNQEFNV